MSANRKGLSDEVAAVQTHSAQFSACSTCGLDGGLNALGDVVRINQKGCIRAKGGDLSVECLALTVVKQGECVGGSTDHRDSVALAGLEI